MMLVMNMDQKVNKMTSSKFELIFVLPAFETEYAYSLGPYLEPHEHLFLDIWQR